MQHTTARSNAGNSRGGITYSLGRPLPLSPELSMWVLSGPSMGSLEPRHLSLPLKPRRGKQPALTANNCYPDTRMERKRQGHSGLPKGPPEVMTIDELAGYLQVSKSSLYKLAQDGRVPGQKVGRHWRFHRATIDEWLTGTVRDSKPAGGAA